MELFKLKKRGENGLYIYLEPNAADDGESSSCKYEVLDQNALWERYEKGLLSEGCRLFKIDREIKVSFERVIHLD